MSLLVLVSSGGIGLRYPILWDGHLARPCIIRGPDARTTRNFGIFF
jgi:hypothetical protein